MAPQPLTPTEKEKLAALSPAEREKIAAEKFTKLESIRLRARDKAREELDEEKSRRQPNLSLISADQVKPERIKTFFGGRLVQGAFQLMVGPGESGKGMCSTDIISRLSTGEPFPGEGSEWRDPIRIVLCVTEDSASRVRGRLLAAGAELKHIYFSEGPPAARGGLIVPSPIAFDSDAGALLKQIQQVNAGALFLETTVEHLGDRERRRQWSTNNERDVRDALAPIIALCKEGRIIGWGVMHPRKSTEGGIEDSIGGSAAFRNIGRSILHVVRDPLDINEKSPWRLLMTSKSNYLAHRPVTLRFKIESWERDADEGRVVWGIEGKSLIDIRSADSVWRQIRDMHHTKRKDFAVQDAETVLKQLLGDGEIHAVEEVRKTIEEKELSWRSAEIAKDNLGIESVKKGFPAKVLGWRLPSKQETNDGGASDL